MDDGQFALIEARQLFLVEDVHTNRATPIAFRCLLQWWDKAVHMVAAITIVTEEKLVIVLGGAAKGARFALNALPGVFLHADLHVLRELEAGRVACTSTDRAADQLFGSSCFFVVVLVPEAEVTVSSWLGLVGHWLYNCPVRTRLWATWPMHWHAWRWVTSWMRMHPRWTAWMAIIGMASRVSRSSRRPHSRETLGWRSTWVALWRATWPRHTRVTRGLGMYWRSLMCHHRSGDHRLRVGRWLRCRRWSCRCCVPVP